MTKSEYPSVLVISSRKDGHIAGVADELEARGIDWIRLNTEDFASNANMRVEPAYGAGVVRLADSGRTISLSSIKAVWHRKPDPLNLSHFQIESAGLDYVEAEFREILDGLYALLTNPAVFWINNPLTTRISHRKLLQLKVANDVGFRTPKTIVTNDPTTALAFGEEVAWDLAVKSLGAIAVTHHGLDHEKQYGIFTRRVNERELRAVVDKITFMPTLLQEYVPKAYELRVTCVDRKVFNCRIFSQDDPDCAEDFRLNARNLRHEICEMPELVEPLFGYMERFNINFGCFDFAVTPSGEPVFFECNPNGQFLWIEQLTGARISAAVAEMIASKL